MRTVHSGKQREDDRKGTRLQGRYGFSRSRGRRRAESEGRGARQGHQGAENPRLGPDDTRHPDEQYRDRVRLSGRDRSRRAGGRVSRRYYHSEGQGGARYLLGRYLDYSDRDAAQAQTENRARMPNRGSRGADQRRGDREVVAAPRSDYFWTRRFQRLARSAGGQDDRRIDHDLSGRRFSLRAQQDYRGGARGGNRSDRRS